MTEGPQPDVRAEISDLTASIQKQTAATQTALTQAPAGTHDGSAHELPEHQELCRRLSALRDRVARARTQLTEPAELRAELATLSFFAGTLWADAESWRATIQDRIDELARQEAAVRLEQERLAAQRRELLRRRDALQAEIDRAAAQVAVGRGAECRPTVPVIQFAHAVTVSSITVSRPRRLFRTMRLWLVTLSEDQDRVLVRPD